MFSLYSQILPRKDTQKYTTYMQYFKLEDFKDWPKQEQMSNTLPISIKNQTSTSIGRTGTVAINAVNIGFFSEYPTNNCQLWCLASFENMMGNTEHKRLIKAAWTATGGKNMLLVDIHQLNVSKAKLIFKPTSLILEANYNSTNGSKMTILLFNTQEIKTWDNVII